MEYFIKSSALLIVFYLCYTLLLKRDTFFQTNRWFLLLGLIVSFSLPLVTIPIYITKEISTQFVSLNSNLGIENTQVETSFNWLTSIAFIYIIGIIILSIRFLSQLISLAFILSKNTLKKQDGYIYVETQKAIAPFSFFNYIVFNPSHFNHQELKHIIDHEKVHANENHSIDILISHLASIVWWFNPIVWLYKKHLQQNLEFIADHKALSHSNCKKTYQYVLLKTSVPNYQMALTNNFYNSLIKKRIVMLHKNKSKKRNQFKTLLILPVLAVFLMSFSTKEIITYTTVENQPNETSTIISDAETLPVIKEDLPKPSANTNRIAQLAVVTPKKKPKKEDVKGNLEIIVITKDMSDQELDAITARLEKEGITLKFKGIKRNKNNEIKAIKITAKSKNSNASISQTEDDAIDPITIKIENGSISIGDGHDSGHRDYIFESHDGKTKVHTSKGANIFVHSDGEAHEDHEIIEDEDKIIIKSGKTVKEIKKGEKGKSLWVTSADKDGKHQVIEIEEDNTDGNTFILKKEKDGKLIKSSSKSLWISDGDDEDEKEEDQEHYIFKTNDGDHNIFITRDDHGKKPLFVVNGKIIGKGKLENLDPNTIESINVIKGEAAIKKYGNKGKDGVIEITTKGN